MRCRVHFGCGFETCSTAFGSADAGKSMQLQVQAHSIREMGNLCSRRTICERITAAITWWGGHVVIATSTACHWGSVDIQYGSDQGGCWRSTRRCLGDRYGPIPEQPHGLFLELSRELTQTRTIATASIGRP